MANRKIAIGAALLGGILLATLLIQHQLVLAARVEQAELQARLRELTNAAAQTPKPILDTDDKSARVLADLERLRVEAGALRDRVAQLAEQERQWSLTNSALQPVRAIPSGNAFRASEARDVGLATPADMMQTFVWAMVQGDTNRVSQSLVMDAGTDPAQAQEILAKIMKDSADMRSEGHSADLDKLEVRILGQQPGENADQWILVNSVKGETNGDLSRVLTRPTDSGWALVIGTNGQPVEEQIQPQP